MLKIHRQKNYQIKGPIFWSDTFPKWEDAFGISNLTQFSIFILFFIPGKCWEIFVAFV